jgi:hypothetical protein
VASFFLSHGEGKVDPQLVEESPLRGQVAVLGAAADPMTVLRSADGADSQQDEITLTPQRFHGGVSILTSKFMRSPSKNSRRLHLRARQ